MARIDNLTNFLTDVATSIKTKTGDSTAIPASQFDTKIANITTGHLDNTEYAEANDDLDEILENSQLPEEWYITDARNLFYEGARTDVLEALISKCKAVTKTDRMFWYAQDVKNIDLSDMDTSAVTNMENMFYTCRSLQTLNVSGKFNTSNVTNMNSMFRNTGIQNLDLSNWDVKNVKNMGAMFYDGRLQTLNVTNWNTSSVTNISYMFYRNSDLSNIDISGFNLSSITSIDNMFYNCPSLSENSLNSILKAFTTAINYTGTKTLKYIGLTSTQATTCQGLSNYQAFLDAGWTTGY